MNSAVLLVEVIILVGFSAVCSGLNIALLSLDVADLDRKAKLGNPQARKMLGLRKNSHLTLAAILLSNVAAASGTAIVLGGQFNGFVAGIMSTLLLVTFGEVLPQALFARHALEYTARLSWLMRTMIVITYPVSKSLQLLLDNMLGQETPELQTRHELGLMVTEHLGNDNSDLDEDEVEIIRGALQLSEKRTRDIMTPIRHVSWLQLDDQIDEGRIEQIKQHGWSRIPIFNKQLTRCHGILLIKDLLNIDFTAQTRTVRDLPLYPVTTVGSMTALDTMFRTFIKEGTHLIPIERDGSIAGIVTIEDLLEEIVGHEIEDETDRTRTHKARRH